MDPSRFLQYYLDDAIAVVLILLVAFAAYHTLLAVGGWRRRPTVADTPPVREEDAPLVTFLVTAYQEPDTTVPCIDSILALEHPRDRLRVVLVVDEDDDGTADVVRERLAGPGLRVTSNAEGDEVLYGERVTAVIQRGARAGRGKPRALQNGLRYVAGDGLVGIVDADHVLRPDFLRHAIPHFDDARVGAVQGRREPKTPPDGWIARWDVLEQNVGFVQALMARDRVGAACFYGSTALIRADLLRDVGWENCLAEDTLLHYELRERGYRVAYEPLSGSLEDHVTELRHYVPQRRRWAAGHMQVFYSKLRSTARAPLRIPERADAFFNLNYFTVAIVLVAYWLLRSFHYWVQGPEASVAAVAGLSALTGAVAFTFERRAGRRGSVPAYAAVAGALLAFSTLSVAASHLAPAPTSAPVPAVVDFLLFAAPLMPILGGYLNPVVRPRVERRREHAWNAVVVLGLAPFMVVVNLYATLTGILVSLERPDAAWVKTVRTTTGGDVARTRPS